MRGHFSQETLNDIKSRLDLVELIGQSVALKRNGSNFKGLCPLHQEKTPSFVVSPAKQMYHCFGCGEGGNHFTFLMKRDGLTFPEAVRTLAERVGVRLELQEEKAGRSQHTHRKLLAKINRYALWFFSHELAKTQDNPQSPAHYLKGRGVSEAITQHYQLGFGGPSPQGLGHFLKHKKVPLQESLELGLIKQGQHGDTYDLFRERLIFPIRDLQGTVIGFGGRQLVDHPERAKYINSPESPLYHKGAGLYGLYEARDAIHRTGRVLLVEGYLDVLVLAANGIEEVVAPLGTALTPEQVKLLAPHAKEFYLVFDGDEAGWHAAWRATRTCLKGTINPRLVLLPQNEDPASLVQHQGAAPFMKLVLTAGESLQTFMVKGFERTGSHPEKRSQNVRELYETILEVSDTILQKEYMAQLARIYGLAAAQLSWLASPPRVDGLQPEAGLPAAISSAPKNYLVTLLVHFPDFLSETTLMAAVKLALTTEEVLLIEKLQQAWQTHGRLDCSEICDGLEDAGLKNLLASQALTVPTTKAQALEALQECAKRVRRQTYQAHMKELSGKIARAETTKDHAHLALLLQEKNALANQHKKYL